MAISKSHRIPRNELTLVFAAAAFPIYTWGVIRFLEQLPAWLNYLDIWQVLSIFAYTQVFALVESLLVAVALVLVAIVLPAGLFRNAFVPTATAIILLNAVWALLAQYNDGVLRQLPARQLALWAAAYAISLLATWFLLRRWRRFQQALHTLAEKISALLYLYLPLSAASLLIMLIRNL